MTLINNVPNNLPNFHFICGKCNRTIGSSHSTIPKCFSVFYDCFVKCTGYTGKILEISYICHLQVKLNYRNQLKKILLKLDNKLTITFYTKRYKEYIQSYCFPYLQGLQSNFHIPCTRKEIKHRPQFNLMYMALFRICITWTPNMVHVACYRLIMYVSGFICGSIACYIMKIFYLKNCF